MLYQDIVLSWHSAPAPRGCWVPLCFEIVRGGFLAVSNDQFWQRMRNVSEGLSSRGTATVLEFPPIPWDDKRPELLFFSCLCQEHTSLLFSLP
eukprot:Polyplicarium_translucidae@DN115_c0_g1_i1.p2